MIEADLMRMLDPQPWMRDGFCTQTGVGLADEFFPPVGGSNRIAKAVCEHCPVRDACLAYALDHHPIEGVWGGTSEYERRLMLGMRGRGHVA